MNDSFRKFKKRLRLWRLIKVILAGVSVGTLAFGLCLILEKLEIIKLSQGLSALLAGGCALLAATVVFLALWTTDKKLARQLDAGFSLHERVQTMVAFSQERGGMYELQREDVQRTLAEIPRRRLRAKRLWIYLILLAIGVGTLTSGLLIKEKEPYIPPEEVIPFELSAMQEAGIEELIRYVDSSEMEEPYKSDILQALSQLLESLRAATTEPEMQAALAKALTAITETTYDASSMTEILNELWDTGDVNTRMLAKALNTAYWQDPDWGDFAEKYDAFCKALKTQEDEVAVSADTLRWTLENLSRKISGALTASRIAAEDPLYAALGKLVNGSLEKRAADETGTVIGLSVIPVDYKEASVEELLAVLDQTLSAMTDELYGVISTQKINTNVGEYTLKRLGMLFSAPIPPFERPEFVKNGEDIDRGDQDLDDDRDENTPSSGGVGEGVTFGSNDLVLDPLTGEYVEYGTLYAKYNTLMNEKLNDEKYGYTEEQKKAIEKYFALLYSGFKDEEE